VPSPQVSLEVAAVPVLSRALAHAGVGALDDLRITNGGPAVAGAELRVTVATAGTGSVDADPDREFALSTVTVPVDLPAFGSVSPAVPAVPDPAALSEVADTVPGTVRVAVLVGAAEVATAECPVTVIGHDRWAGHPIPLALELLAVHVLPQHPALDPVLALAARLLAPDGSAGGRLVEGYVAEPDRVDERVRAIVQAVHAQRIRLLAPDAHWPTGPQQIRHPGQVIGESASSALDLALLVAACLERIGVHPLVWIADPGPAVGYWREDRTLPAAATTDVDGVVNLVDLGLIGGVDPARIAAPDADAPRDDAGHPGTAGWDGAVAACRSLLHDGLAEVHGVLDVQSARRDRIYPLPAPVSRPDGTAGMIDYRPPERAGRADAAREDDALIASPRRVGPDTPATSPSLPPRVAQWKNALLDLSLRNRLLNYTGRGAVPLAVPPGMLAALEDTIHAGGSITLLPADRLSDVQARRGIRIGRDLTEEQRAELLATKHCAYTDVPTEHYLGRMRSLAYRARTIAEETGANHLYLALGTLVWNLDGRDLRSPVVLVPVALSPRSRRGDYRIELDQASTSTPNYCLLEKLRQVHGLSVRGLAQPVEDSAGIDLDAAFRALRTALAGAGLNYRVEQTAGLALLAFAKFRLWKDLDEHWQDLARNPLVEHLITAPTAMFTDPATDPAIGTDEGVDLDEVTAALPIAADASQADAIAAASSGHTFVLEGPPGTGKSQTITNLLAHAVAQGRRVLFVAEKRAALDVVTRRLAAVGLAPFCLDLHDKGAKPAVVRTQIRAALELRVADDEQGRSAAAEELRAATGQLARYAERLHRPNAAGLSYYSAHTRSLAVGDGPELPIPHSAVATPDVDLAAVRSALASLPDVADPAHPAPDHPWGFVDPPDPASVDAAALAGAVGAVDAAIDRPVTTPEVAAALAAARTPSDVRDVARFAGRFAVDLALLDLAVTDRWRREAADARAAVVAFCSATQPGLDLATPEVFALPVDGIDAEARAADASSWFGRKKRQLAVLARLQPGLRPAVTVPHQQVSVLTGHLAGVWREIVRLQLRVAEVAGLQPPDGWNPLTAAGQRWLDERIGWLTWASDTAALRDQAGAALADPDPFRLAVRRLLDSRAVVGLDDRDAVAALDTALGALSEISGGDAPFAAWSGGGLLAAWRRTGPRRRPDAPGLAALRRYLDLLVQLQPLRSAGLGRARQLLLSGGIPANLAARAFDAGLATTSLAERAAATGLDGFDGVAHDRAVRRFADASERVRGQLVTAIPARLVASRTFDATSSFGRIGELSRELVKQRRGLAVRPLLARYGDLVTTVMPCMLVSPDSLARFFPPQPDLFDLVVFDEASQIRVADAIGALGRARAAVIVGDSKQMPPTSVAESVADPLLDGSDPGDADQDPASDLLAVPDEESILSECVQAGVPRRWLSWHYRSHDEALIAFSNRRYYSDRLSTFPSPLHGTADPGVRGHGVNLIRVNGTFLRSHAGGLLRTNPVEADAVVAEIQRRFAADPDVVPSIGVVTLNAPQRTLVEAKLRDLDDDRIDAALDRTDGEGLFIKNLENVQGDERDVILFSTAFSANARGVLPLNFGPLNQIGGERRLNVAVTRARRQVVVFSSFDPDDLRAEQTTSQGIKDLRAYLELARAGADATMGSSPQVPAPDRHRDEIAAAAAGRGLAVRSNVGLSGFTLDLVVGAGSAADLDPRVAVLLDGPEWAARHTVGDRDGLPVQVLSALMRWPVVARIWLPDWLRDKEGVLDRLQDAVRLPDLDPALRQAQDPAPAPDRARRGPATGPAEDAPPGRDTVRDRGGQPDHSGADHSGPPDQDAATPGHTRPLPAAAADPVPANPARSGLVGESPFTPWISGYLGSRAVLDELPEVRAVTAVARALHDAVVAEGPVHVDRLAKLVAGGFDLGRVSAERRRSILGCLPDTVFRDRSDPHFAWPAELDPATWTGFRRTGAQADRPLEQVSSREIGNAMVAICVAGAGVARDQLESETLRIFGFHRRTAALLSLLEAALRRAVDEGRLRVDGDVVRAT
jgi:hypothetical protein